MPGVPDLGLLLIKLLAVAGSAALGWIGAGAAVGWGTRLTLRRKLPAGLLVVVRLLGGLIAGWLVYWWLFQAGGTGGFGGSGGGWWPFGGRGSGSNQGATTTTTAPRSTEPGATKPLEVPTSPPLRVILLGGDRVVAQRFYLLGEETMARTLTELEPELLRWREAHAGPPRPVLEIVLYRNSVDRENPAVAELKDWAEQHGFAVKLDFPNEELRQRPGM